MTAGRPRRLVLFDVDGTLIKVYGAGRRALEDAFRAVFDCQDVAAHLDPVWFAGKTDLYIFRQIAVKAGIAARDYERRYPDLEAAYLDRLQAHVDNHPDRQILPGVEALLQALTADPEITLGLMTGNLEAGTRIKLSPWSLNRFFETGGFGSDALDRVDIGAVARERAERRLGVAVPPAAVTVVGDTIHDVAAARACGFRAIAVGTGWTEAETLRSASPDLYVDDLSDPAVLTDALRS